MRLAAIAVRTGAASLLTILFLSGCDQTVDKGDDKLTEGRQSIEVRYKGSAQDVLFDNLATEYPIDDETPVVYVDDIVLGSGLVTTLDGTWINFVGEDGFHPIGVCPADYAPTPGEMAHLGFVERGTTRLIWDEKAELDKCMSVKDIVIVEVADKADDLPLDSSSDADSDSDADADGDADGDSDSDADAVPFENVTIHFDETAHTVDPTGLETSDLGGVEVVMIDALIAAAGVDVDLTGYTIDFEGGDGYRPSAKGTCEDYLPAPGERAAECGVNIDTSRLAWEPSLEVESCAEVKWIAHIYVDPV